MFLSIKLFPLLQQRTTPYTNFNANQLKACRGQIDKSEVKLGPGY